MDDMKMWIRICRCCCWLGFWLYHSISMASGVDLQGRSITLALSQEPPDLNSLTSTDAVSGFVLDHVLEGLLRYDSAGNLVGGVAERWQLTSEGATFWLRKNARWSDGRAVTAQDFVHAWRLAVQPETASEYAFILFPIANAEAINAGQLPVEALGVTAVDDTTLTVRFHQPCPYFPGLTAFRTFYPVRQDFYEAQGGKYGVEADHLLSNGPFVLTHWVHGAALRLQRNPEYWNRDNVWLNAIDVPYITSDPVVHLNLYRDGKIAMVDGLGSDNLEVALRERLQIKSFLDGAIFYLEFNHRPQRITSNLSLRRAIQSVIDVDELVYKVIATPGTSPTSTIFPRWMMGAEAPFTKEYPPARVPRDIQQGRRYLAQALEELELSTLPPLHLLADDGPGGQKTTQYLQTLLQEALGIEVRVDMQIFKQRLAKMSSGDFDLVIAGWGPDYNDLLTYGDLFYSRNMNNRGRYSSAAYDQQVNLAQSLVDTSGRLAAFASMQQLLTEDVIILPLYERGRTYIEHPQLKGVVRRAIGGDPSFYSARIKARN